MPRVNIWIRKEDEEKWNALTNKSELIHASLNGNVINTKFIVDESIRPIDSDDMVPASRCDYCDKYACECDWIA